MNELQARATAIARKPPHQPFYLQQDVEAVVESLTSLRAALEIDDELLQTERRKLLTQVNRDLRYFIPLARRRRL